MLLAVWRRASRRRRIAPSKAFMASKQRPGKRRRAADASASTVASEDEARAYDTWLQARGVWWRREAMRTSTHKVAAGWGVVAQSPIEAGEILCVIPPAACFGARVTESSAGGGTSDSDDSDGGDMQRDTQRSLATLLLQEQAKGDSSDWAPLLAMLTPAHTPLVWSPAAARFLCGTELEPVLAQKRLRMLSERGACD